MSHKSFLEFLVAARDSPAVGIRYSRRSLVQLLFHARNEGFDFTADDVAAVAGALEANVIVGLDGDPFDGTSRLWRRMWGTHHLRYLVDHVVGRHTDTELWSVVNRAGAMVPEPERRAEIQPERPPVSRAGNQRPYRPPERPGSSSDGPGQHSDDGPVDFLRLVAARTDMLECLKVAGKAEVLAVAAGLGYGFGEPEFDARVWDLEVALAAHRGERFDARFPLWQTMWGAYYLEYLVTDLVPSLVDTRLVN
jgi:hypothetical protein